MREQRTPYDKKILFNFATRGRPKRYADTMLNLLQMTETREFMVLVKFDIDDTHMIQSVGVDIPAALDGHVIECWGTSVSKVDAINRGIDGVKYDWDILVNLSDDMTFTIAGYDRFIRRICGNDSFVHFPDNYAGENVCTMSIIGRTYYERDHYVYNPNYYSLWCDNEAMEVAKIRGCYVYSPLSFIQHNHYSNGLAAKDPLYQRNDTYSQDRQIFEQRKANNFYL